MTQKIHWDKNMSSMRFMYNSLYDKIHKFMSLQRRFKRFQRAVELIEEIYRAGSQCPRRL